MKSNHWAGMVIGWLLCVPMLWAQEASSILDKTVSVLEDAKGVTVTFTVQARSGQYHVSESFEGTIDIKGDKFVLKTPDMVTWFDGETQWSYVEQTQEVNVSTPTGDELQAVNPVLLLQSYQKGFKAQYEGECTATNGKAAYEILLLPKKKGHGIERMELQVEKYSSLPASIMIRTQDGIDSTIRISRIQTGADRSDSYFIFPEADYPEAEIIDLR